MDEPIPILQGNPSPAEARLLGSADLDLPPRDGAARVLLALGVGATSVMAASKAAAQLAGSGGTASSAAAASASGMGAVFAKYVALGAVIGASVTGAGEVVRAGLDGSGEGTGPKRAPVSLAPSPTEHGRKEALDTAPAAALEERPAEPPSRAGGAAPQREASKAPPREATHGAHEAAPPATTLTDEVRALDEARALLARGEAGRSLGALDAFARRFSTPSLGLEADLLRVEVLIAVGRAREANALGERLLRSGEGPHTRRLRSLLERGGGAP